LAIFQFFRVRRKFLYIVVVVAAVSGLQGFMGNAWSDRMSTMKSATGDSSAMGRVAAWMWTLDYVKEHPLGGGFDVYRINTVEIQLDDGTIFRDRAKAFHSMYFEVLGEQGIPGIILLMSMLFWSLRSLQLVRKRARGSPENAWQGDAASALQIATLVYMAGGAFVGVAYLPYLWYLYSIGIALRHYSDGLVETRTESPALTRAAI